MKIEHATEFLLDEILDTRLRLTHPIKRTWAVCRGNSVLDSNGEWQYSSLPSSRTEEHMRTTRYASVEEAIDSYMNYWRKIVAVVAVSCEPREWSGYELTDPAPETITRVFNSFSHCNRVVLFGPGRFPQRMVYKEGVKDEFLPNLNF
jgi:hypothetical protein